LQNGKERNLDQQAHGSEPTRPYGTCALSLLGPHIGQLRLTQVEFPLDSAPRFIF